jgi:hypothetical protein
MLKPTIPITDVDPKTLATIAGGTDDTFLTWFFDCVLASKGWC